MMSVLFLLSYYLTILALDEVKEMLPDLRGRPIGASILQEYVYKKYLRGYSIKKSESRKIKVEEKKRWDKI